MRFELWPLVIVTDETYWTNGHTLLDEVGCCPVFFSEEFSPTVFSAGKSLHLLKLCSPNVGVAASTREHL